MKKQNDRLSFRIPHGERLAIERIARRQDMRPSQLIRRWLKAAILKSLEEKSYG